MTEISEFKVVKWYRKKISYKQNKFIHFSREPPQNGGSQSSEKCWNSKMAK